MTMTANGLAKMIEECGEVQVELGQLIQVAGKRLAFYYTDQHPDGGLPLTERLENEIADVTAACKFFAQRHGLNLERILQRFDEKMATFEAREALESNNQDAVDSSLHGPTQEQKWCHVHQRWENRAAWVACDDALYKQGYRNVGGVPIKLDRP
jgi:NTP pyrophosphatase (non-canonical NTP hydrolase)